MLPALHAWARTLRHLGLLQDLTLCSYEPEIERYGGAEAMEAAEQVFHTRPSAPTGDCCGAQDRNRARRRRCCAASGT
ncbi:thiopeptide-type bacteriocin biosynthesis protein [Streptomyces sp. C36]|uniref:thiopeptide-type bacteriocin biosynthesis protein n=1 Tax=Streptomyces sp. C36 TaxID=3237122 RepID=UPI0034C6B581